MNIFEFLVDSFKNAPLLIQFAFIVVVLMMVAIITLIIYLKTIRSFLDIKDNEISRYKKEYEALVIEYLYSGGGKEDLSEAQEAIILKIRKGITSISRRKSVITILSNLMNEVSGEMSDSIQTLYRKIGLIDYAKERLNSEEWHITAKAIAELRRFKIHETQDIVLAFIDHPKEEVRKEAQLYSVHLFKFNGLSFLDNLELPLSEWHQLQLLEALLNLDTQEITDIEPWLKSSNPSVVLFALKLTKIYNQFDMKDNLIDLLSHPEKEVRTSATRVLNVLFNYEAQELIALAGNTLNKEEQVALVAYFE